MKFLFSAYRSSIGLFIFFFCIASLHGAVTGYLKIGDIKGESQAAGHEEELDIFQFEWAITD
ncbi:MAG: type VI secretion system tube protein Hcp [Verrucomicrobia bacterium]|nr:type VI secretion system tube protein Hcp [Verrucomicrobiota bacterium]